MSHTRTLYVVHGLKRAGKGTTVSLLKALLEERGAGDFVALKHAAPIKEMTEIILRSAGYTDPAFLHACIEDEHKETQLPGIGDLTPREVMQYVGTQLRNRFNPRLWNEIMALEYRRYMGTPSYEGNIAVDDARFDAEMEYSKLAVDSHPTWKRVTIKITRPGAVDAENASTPVPRYAKQVINEGMLHPGVAENLLDYLYSSLPSRYNLSDEQTRELFGHTAPHTMLGYLISLFTDVARHRNDPTPHASEQGLPDDMFDHVIINDGTKNALRAKLSDVLDNYTK